MLKLTMKFKDYNEQEREETFLFNLTQAEVAELELSTEGGFSEKIKRIAEHIDGGEIVRTFKQIILAAYGEKSPDGRQFVKSEAISTAFSQTQAYSDLFIKLMTDPVEAAKFVDGILPKVQQ